MAKNLVRATEIYAAIAICRGSIIWVLTNATTTACVFHGLIFPLQLGTPNACVNCHDDKTDQWALQWVNKWYGEKKKAHYGTVLADADAGKAGADSGLLRIINSNLYPEIIRATAIGYLSAYQSAKAQEAVRKALNDPDPLLRHAAAENYMAADSATLVQQPCAPA